MKSSRQGAKDAKDAEEEMKNFLPQTTCSEASSTRTAPNGAYTNLCFDIEQRVRVGLSGSWSKFKINSLRSLRLCAFARENGK